MVIAKGEVEMIDRAAQAGHLVLGKLTKSYGAVVAVDSVEFSVSPGEFVALLGPSGCGKSTLLRMIAGLESISSGELWIDGREVANVHPRDRDIAMVFQNYALYPHMTVAKNLGYPLRLRGMSGSSIEARVAEVAALLELGPLLERRPAELSGGQRQRVAMGRALVRDPALFLMDEPLSNLDARLRQQMRSEIVSLQRRLKTTTVYVTHDQVEAMTMADRIVIMNKGVVQQVGRPYDVFLKPANLFVAEFIGSPAMNLFPADCLPDGPFARPGQMLGIRAEDVLLSADTVPEGLGLKGVVVSVEALGADSFCRVEIQGLFELVVRVPGNAEPLTGKAVDLHIPASAMHHFDTKSGLRIG
jgi:ABC-type sugar transport system ATPase subunit